jgi:3-hydroxyanthranilate 3,4-dioxygenase
MDSLAPINFRQWIDENRHLLKPPVGNRQIWENREFMVTVVGGPNSRTDYHVNEGEEFFYQVEGTIILRVMEQGKPRNIEIREGDIFLLPPKVPHSPQRPAGTVGLVLERKRRPGERDSFVWFCPSCGKKLHQETLHVTDIVKQLPPVFENFYGSDAHCICRACGTRVIRPQPV